MLIRIIIQLITREPILFSANISIEESWLNLNKKTNEAIIGF
jgi:hypothetical protein